MRSYVLYQNIATECRNSIIKVCFVDRAPIYNLFQMKPTGCTPLLSIFISTSLHVSGNYVSIIRRTYCVYAKPVFLTLYGWLSGRLFQLLYMFRATTWPSSGELTVSIRHWYFSLCMGGCLVCRADSHPYTTINTNVT